MDELTKKQRGFVKDYIETENGVQSALNNYNTTDYNTANQIAVENLQKPTIINAIKSIAEQIPDEDLIRVHKEGLEATNDKGTDFAVRHKYLDSAYKLKGSYAAEKVVNLNITQQTEEQLTKGKLFDEWMKKQTQ